MKLYHWLVVPYLIPFVILGAMYEVAFEGWQAGRDAAKEWMFG